MERTSRPEGAAQAPTPGSGTPFPAPPRILYSSHGRLRVHVPHWAGNNARKVAGTLRQMPGVSSVEANPLTQNVLLVFDPRKTDQVALIAGVRRLRFDDSSEEALEPEPTGPAPTAIVEGKGKHRRMRIHMRGVTRDPDLASRVAKHIETTFGVRARTNPLTGRLVVEYEHGFLHLEELLAEIGHLQLPPLPGEDKPRHPLDNAPLATSLTQSVGAVLGVSVLTFQQLFAPTAVSSAGQARAATVAGLMNLLHGFPLIRNGLRRVLGETGADITSHALAVASLTIAGMPLGLMVLGVEAILMLGEVTARRAAWRAYEDSLDNAVSTSPGAVVRLEAGMRAPRAAKVIEGTGTATGRGGLPIPLSPGSRVPASARLSGGPFVLELAAGTSYTPQPRPPAPHLTRYQQYLRIAGPVSLACAALNGLRFLSLGRAFETMLLLNPRTAVIGQEAANLGAAHRALRSGVTVIGTRNRRPVRRPDLVILDGPSLLTDGMEIAGVYPRSAISPDALLTLTAQVGIAAGSPWGIAFPKQEHLPATDGIFHGLWAGAVVDGVKYRLGPPEDEPDLSDDILDQHEGGYLLELSREETDETVGYVALRPRLSPGVHELVASCKRLDVKVELLAAGNPAAARGVSRRADISLVQIADSPDYIRQKQTAGCLVAFVSDSAEAGASFAACDLAIGLSHGHGGFFPACADLLAPDLRALADLLDAGKRRDDAVRDSVVLSTVANVIGVALSLRAQPLGAYNASIAVYVNALAAMGIGFVRLRGGSRPDSALAYLSDPRPERWGRQKPASVLRAFNTRESGLTAEEANTRLVGPGTGAGREEWLNAFRNQVQAPITAILTGGACLTLVLGQPLNTALLSVTISLNVLAGVWQERQVGKAADALKRMSAALARVQRGGKVMTIPAIEVVPGDILLLAAGDRVAADARLLKAASLEVGEASLTGESLPVVKGPDEGLDSHRVVLEGSDVIVGTATAIVIAVGRHTRLGSTAAALSVDTQAESPMGVRLGRILNMALPVAFTGGTMAALAGLAYGNAPFTQMLTIGVTTALSAIPEGLPLLAGVGQAAVARRLAAKNAVVRRLAGIEALGRVDVTCTDKTGTLTEGRLTLVILADVDREIAWPSVLEDDWRNLLLSASLASPHPDAPYAFSHPTDSAILRAMREADLDAEVRVPRRVEVPFDSARAFYASLIDGRLCLKGAPEKLLARCTHGRVNGIDQHLDEAGRAAWLERAIRLGGRGLRVLLVAQGSPDANPRDPIGLTALGFMGIKDPLRPSAHAAVERCQKAGIRIIMLTGDHPATGGAIGREAGLFTGQYQEVLTASELAELPVEELDRKLERVAVIARAAPLDKLRIVERLQNRGHTVAMTGDGANDAPALRLADVGVAMGKGGTEVARQAADLVLAEDDFAALVEALVEGRSFWRNMRNGLGLLIGGNAGELGLIVGASVMGYGSPLSAPQILLVNMITDALPSLAVLLQKPRNRDLAALAREGLSALDEGLRRDTIRRGVATAVPSLAAYLAMHRLAGPQEASAVGFAGVICTQLAQTVDVGRGEGILSRSVVGAVGGSLVLLGLAVGLPPVRNLLGIHSPSLLGWGAVGVSSAAAVALSRAISLITAFRPGDAHDPVPTPSKSLIVPALG